MSRPRSLCGHHLFLELLGPEAVALDLGAYEGEFARLLVAHTPARVVAVEANPAMHRRMPRMDRVTGLNLAVGDREGSLRLHLGANPLSSSLLPTHPYAGATTVEVRAMTLERLVSEHCGGRLDLLKSNIEGAEIPMLRAADDALLASIGQITIQFHDFMPELDQAEDVRRAKERLRDLGFGEILFKAPNKDVLFVNLAAGLLGRGRFRAETALVRLRQYARAGRKKLRF